MGPDTSAQDGIREQELAVLIEDGERTTYRGWREPGIPGPLLAVFSTAPQPRRAFVDRLLHEYELADDLDSAWSARPRALIHDGARTLLLLEDPGGFPLESRVGAPMALESFLRFAVAAASALGKVHQRGLIHREIKPANILVDEDNEEVRFTGFGIASRLPRERQSPEPPSMIAGAMAYMAPEQTGRMNRSTDSRSDLYSLGVTLYQALTGSLPFNATDPMEWIHCHIARSPPAPSERIPSLPPVVSAIVQKLLAKPAEERYQTAAALEHDLRRCLDRWQAHQRIDDFPLGEHDVPDRLLVLETPHGREREIATLLASFHRVATIGVSELVLVSGYSGIGKSTVVHELHKSLVPSHGLFAAGKFERYKRDIPYATLAQAFQALVRMLLAKSESELAPWREAIREALGPNGVLLCDLVPDLRHIVGDSSPVPPLPLQDAQARVHLVMRRFIGVFARPEHPLVLFLDDLQWVDAATLEMLADILAQGDIRNLLLIGAYRDNEVDSMHSLRREIDALRRAGAHVQDIRLAPMRPEDVASLIVASLHSEPPEALLLAGLVHEKTGGNPFFVVQFLHALFEERLLRFDHANATWRWNLDAIRARRHTENVIELMVARLGRLPAETLHLLQQLACLGNRADTAMLGIAYEIAGEQVHARLMEPLRLGLLARLDGSYAFAHDRIQEATYSLVPESSRAISHLRLGRLLLAKLPAQERDEHIFEIVHQLNLGMGLMEDREEREYLAGLNLMAGKRARASSAYASALAYLSLGESLLTRESWRRRYSLAFELALARAECEFLTGDLTTAERRLSSLSRRAADSEERAAIACLRINLQTTLEGSEHSVRIGLEYLQSVGIDWSQHPRDDEVQQELERMWQQIRGRPISALRDLPHMTDRQWRATMNVFTTMLPPALFTDENLLCLIVGRMANVSMEHGNSDGSCLAYVWLGLLLGPRLGEYRSAFEFGRLGFDLVERGGLDHFRARVYLDYSHVVIPWMQHARAGPALVRQALNAAHSIGDLNFAAFSGCNLVSALLAAGERLDIVQQEAERQLEFARKTRFGLIVDIISGQLRFIESLRGGTDGVAMFDGPEFDTQQFERRLDEDPGTRVGIGWYWVRKLQGLVLAGDNRRAAHAAAKVAPYLWTMPSHLEVADFHFYAALARASFHDDAAVDDQASLLDATRAHRAQFEVWQEHCRENFEARHALISAELARVERRDLDAMHLYEQAIALARKNGFVHDEAIANESAARFHASRGLETIAHAYLRNARYCYIRWGADGKVAQLDESYPVLRQEPSAAPASGTIGAPVDHLDLATVIKVSQAVSGEMVFERLMDTLMRAAIAHAGAERGVLILARGAAQRIAAEATTSGDTVAVRLRDDPVSGTALPESVLQYVQRTGETVILDDAAANSPFEGDPYIRQCKARSVLCLPLLNQSKLIGVLYLENNLSPRVFAAGRMTVLKLLASQAAISLENTHLYRDLAEREAKIRRLVEADIIGIFIWNFEGEILEANDVFLRTVGYEREDLVSGRLQWTALTPPELRERDERALMDITRTGSARPYEKEYIRRDGDRVSVMIGAATFEAGGKEGVAFVLDLTERKRAEAERLKLEERLRQAEKLEAIGRFASGIAHDFNNMLGGILAYGEMLFDEAPDDAPRKRYAQNVLLAATRGRELVEQILAYSRSQRAHHVPTDLCRAITETLELLQTSVPASVTFQASIPEAPLIIVGHATQVHQVVMNLFSNALQAMSAGGALRVALTRIDVVAERAFSHGSLTPGRYANLRVEDTGIGMDAATLARIFEPFFTTKPAGRGTGLGLALVSAIVTDLGGVIDVTSAHGEGSTFAIDLPLTAAADPAQE